jgi:hypothetical protein
MAVGPSYVVEMVNLGGEIFTKQGSPVTTFSLYSFPFNFPAADRLSDPRVIYDAESSRWFATLLDVTAGNFQVAVSRSSDPTGGWTTYAIGGVPSGDFPDQPILGVSSNMVAIGGNDYPISGGAFVGGQFWVLNKAAMVTAAPVYYSTWGPSCGFLCTYPASIHPVRSLSATSTQFFVSTGFGSSSTLVLYSVTGTPPGSVAASSSTLPIKVLTNPPSAPQLGSSTTLDTGDGRVSDAVWSNNVLWLSANDGCTPLGDSQARSCFRLIQIDTATSSLKIDQDWANVGTYYFYPALSVDSIGDMSVAVGYSSSAYYPGIDVWGQAYNEPNSLEPGLALTGNRPSAAATYPSCSGTCRYGDYFGASTDPSGTSVWFAGEYGAAGTLWSTYIGNAVTLPLSVSSITASPSSTDVGQTTVFSVSASGGTSGYRYAWSGLPSSCIGADQPSLFCTTVLAGGFSVAVTVTDSYGTSITTPPLFFSVYPDPTVVTPTATPGSGGVDVGQVVTFSTSASGGSGGYSFAWLGLPGCPSQNLPSFLCTTRLSGMLSVSVIATDTNGFAITSGDLSYLVLADPTVGAPSVSRQSLDVGQTVNISVAATGGSPPYTYVWNDLPPGCGGTATALSCAPASAGRFNVSVTITDSNGFSTASSGHSLVISPRLDAELSAHPDSFLQGQGTILTGTALGGRPGYTYAWSGLPPGCAIPSQANNSCTPTTAGTFRVVLTVTDQNGARVSSTVLVVVEPSFLGLPAVQGYALVAGSMATVLAASAALVWRRKKRKS